MASEPMARTRSTPPEDGDEQLMNLHIRVPKKLLRRYREMGESMEIPVRRNDLIIHVLKSHAEKAGN